MQCPVLPPSGMVLVRSLRHDAAGGVQDRTGLRVLCGPLRQPGRRPPLDGTGHHGRVRGERVKPREVFSATHQFISLELLRDVILIAKQILHVRQTESGENGGVSARTRPSGES